MSRRIAKVSEAIRETVSSTILFELRDPRVKNVTVISAEVGADLRTAKVYVSIMGDEKLQALTMHGLNAAKGFIQAKLADRLQTRYTPVLTFVNDQGIKKSIEAARIIREALADPAADAAFNQDDEDDLDADQPVLEGDAGEAEASGGEVEEEE